MLCKYWNDGLKTSSYRNPFSRRYEIARLGKTMLDCRSKKGWE